MTEQERRFFDELTKDRQENSVVFDKPSVRGFWKNIVEKYSDQAHFIYELLQNADDAGATSVGFELYEDRLVFRHNGTRHFTLSDPKTEDIDGENGRLGDLNSITSVANSNKNDKSTIGKFGVGFKAVFLYTETPIIYDPDIAFRLEKHIVPYMVPNDYSDRRPDETIFVFPFNHPKKSPAEAYENINAKLQSLVFPQLFLSNIESIVFSTDEIRGEYIKQIKSIRRIDQTVVEDIRLVYKDRRTGEFRPELLWLCTRKTKGGNRYSVGYFHNDKGQLVPRDYPAFCFFPTKEKTGLHFIFHAPFLLTDSREGIQAGEQHNRHMIELLSELAADSLVYLRDIGLSQGRLIIGKNLFSVLPYIEKDFSDLDSRDMISYKPFYLRILEVLRNEEILPASEGYVDADNAYWANMSSTSKIFTDKQLQELTYYEGARWIDIGSGHVSCRTSNYPLFCFLVQELHISFKDEDDLLDGIDKEFILKQNQEWLLAFYNYIVSNKERVDTVKHKPIFIDNQGNPSAAFKYDQGEQAILFLPSDDITGFRTIHPNYASHKETLSLAKALEIRKPSLKEEIYNVILPRYADTEVQDAGNNFLKFFKYYFECPRGETDSFIKLISNKYIVMCHLPNSSEDYLVIPKKAFILSDSNRLYLETAGNIWIVDLEYYEDIGLTDRVKLLEFLRALGVNEQLNLIKSRIIEGEEFNGETVFEPGMLQYAAEGTRWDYNTGKYKSSWILPVIPGIEDALKNTEEDRNDECSVFIWNFLLSVPKKNPQGYIRGYDDVYSYLLRGTFEYFFKSDKTQYFETRLPSLFRETAWLMNVQGDFVSPEDLDPEDLADCYDLSDQYSNDLMKFLHMHIDEDAPEESLSQRQRESIDIGEQIRQAGIPAEEIPEMVALWKTTQRNKNRDTADEISQVASREVYSKEKTHKSSALNDKSVVRDLFMTTRDRVIQDILKINETEEYDRQEEIRKEKGQPFSSLEDLEKFLIDEPDVEHDEDEYIKPTVDYEKKIARAKEKSAEAIDLITASQEYERIASESPRYTYSWFKALLNLEIINSRQFAGNKRNISISFGKVSRESANNRTLVLEHPDRYIPHSIEDVADVKMILRGEGFEKMVAIEVASIRSYTLRVKLKNLDQIAGLDLDMVKQATISVQDPVFLLDELKKALEKLPLKDTNNLQEMLCANIRFVFGPPGTGKTTHLARNVIEPLMKDRVDFRVLVLTPTNKAADVLTTRVMENAPEGEYSKWLIRFGVTADDRIERAGVFKEKTTDIRQYRRCTVVTTIARFPYDFFMPESGLRLPLSDIEWDYVIIDEASMIPLVNIIYPLYQQKPNKFIIAGDPFQIEPIVSIKQWKNENIYTMTGLDSFGENVSTHPYDYPIDRLMTQYRSIPSVGSVFSNFAYGGVLRHYRQERDCKELNLGSDLSVQTMNIIKFPTSKYESIYRPKKLNLSNYQIYSALFTFEFCRFLAERIQQNHPGKNYSIGIVAPYRAESDLIEKLKNTIKLPKNITVQAGTIHGFQGDECDIVMVVLNTPPKITSSSDMFLNKRNIINVAISRAKDYLFVIMPDDNTEGIGNLRLVKKVEALCRKQTDCCACFTTEELERIMFGQPDYLELNSFSTGHQAVNVYGLPEMKYEIRSEDTAVDVQVHEAAKAQELHQASVLPERKHEELKPVRQVQEQPNTKKNIEDQKTGFVPGQNIDQFNGTDKEERYFVIPKQKNKVCPFDQTALRPERANIVKGNGKKTFKLDYKICRICGRKFLQDTQMNFLKSNGILLKTKEVLPEKGPERKPVINDYFRPLAPSRFDIASESRSNAKTVVDICRRQGCSNKVFREGLCLEHFRYAMGFK